MSLEPQGSENEYGQIVLPETGQSPAKPPRQLPPGAFVAREEEQARFREMLLDTAGSRKGFLGSWLGGGGSRQDKVKLPVKSRVMLVEGQPGCGKTQLTLRLRDIALKEKEFARRFKATRLDWAELFERDGRLNALLEGEPLPLDVLLDIWQNHCIRDNAGGYFEEYKSAIEATKNLVRTVNEAELLAVWEYRARALGRSLKAWSAERPLLFFMDGFELVIEATEVLFRPALEEAGSQVFFIFSGERLPQDFNNLVSAERLAAFRLAPFSEAELQRFYDLELERYIVSRSEATISPVYRSPDLIARLEEVTAGQPLAARLSAFLLQTGMLPKDLPLPGDPPLAALVESFIGGPLGPGHPDRLRLYALATLRRPEQGLLGALFDVQSDMLPVNEVLQRLDGLYAFLFEPGRPMTLHPAVSFPLRRWLLDPSHRYDPNGLAKLNERGLAYLNARLEEWSANFPTLRDRVNELKWREWALDKIWYAFWLSKDNGWPEATSLLTAGLGLRPAFARQVVALLESLARIGAFNEVGLKRLELFRKIAQDPITAGASLKELRVMGQEGGFFQASMPQFAAELTEILNNLLK
jgi:hypothetical protein